ncbi:MAG: exodeoxyribonuclease V subunit gamma [Buchnera aphidicola (Nurudea yanoniella)]
MLIIYKSHNYKLLIEKACSIFINSPLSNPLKSEIFITNNENIDHWIKIFISKKYSIASNIKFFRFHKFIWNFSKNISSNYRWTLEFEKYNLIWKMMSIKDIKYLTSFISLSHSQIKLFEIISSLSKKFKEYLLYRPDLIEEWEKNIKKQKNVNSLINKHKLLWKKLIKYIKNKNQSTLNYSNLLFILEKEIQKKNINTNKLPYRIFIFGNKNLTPLNIMFLKIISKICTIYFFYTTPYKNEKKILLNHIKFEKHELTLIKKYTSCFFQATQNYKILLDNAVREKNIIDKISFLGKYGYEYTLLLYLINKKEIHLFKTKKPNYLLQKIQKKIIQTDIKLNCNENKKEMNRKNKIHKDDSSITIHICTTIRREIEVLHENLLNILNTHHDILFHDILIISKDINLYTPFIYSIFNSITPKHYIPFRILSNFNRKTERAIKTIIKILSLPNNPLDNKNIFNLLENPIILKKTKIKEKEISLLYKTIEKFQIEFEFNKNSEQCTSQKNNKKIFLKNTEKRIFLGQAMNDENYTIWKKLVPCNVSNIKNFKTLNKLIQFVLLLRKWKNKLSTSKYLKSWKLILEKLLNDFFENHEHETKEMKSIKNQWNIIIQSGIQENYKKKVSIKLLKNELLKSTPNSEKIHDLFSGKITFCNGFILRNIPFKVICILGMNEEFSTQKTFFENFNIIHKFPRICDPHRKNKYEYLFLETLLSAQKFFLISYYKNSKKKINSIHHLS